MRQYAISLLAAAVLLTPADARAWRGRHHRQHHHAPHRHHRHYHPDVAIGLLGGILGGIIIDRVLTGPPVVVRNRHCPPQCDPYEEGYRNGYEDGIERGRYEGYRRGRHDGYRDGVNASRAGYYPH